LIGSTISVLPSFAKDLYFSLVLYKPTNKKNTIETVK
jgi:hypothetical protein